MGDDSLILVRATIGQRDHVLKTFTGTRESEAVAYADREHAASGLDTRLTAYVAPTGPPSLDGLCLN
ncbi:hypothetical protein K378_01429 [Streptomyces sp. Amel2xB2]|uniref:hypothetical protein n=1 Tax=Streptomyces sp. Amel2xB2 TaxID=1305829 RepID=UPI000DB8FE7B|nr:hypothetical protein [Streptomyces sp. Amel2xB2]RAJ70264.1 hypothetical protein K378_01429 [Streptomyces sp. Amel2xB2]